MAKSPVKGTPEYNSWHCMRSRCDQPKTNSYESYGGRGITYQKSWSVFSNFLQDMGEKPQPNMQLDRIDTNGNYTKHNCRWATPKQNSNNRRRQRWLSFGGTVRTLAEWAELVGLSTQCIHYRLKNGWCVEDALLKEKNHGNGWERIARATAPKEDN